MKLDSSCFIDIDLKTKTVNPYYGILSMSFYKVTATDMMDASNQNLLAPSND